MPIPWTPPSDGPDLQTIIAEFEQGRCHSRTLHSHFLRNLDDMDPLLAASMVPVAALHNFQRWLPSTPEEAQREWVVPDSSYNGPMRTWAGPDKAKLLAFSAHIARRIGEECG